MARRKLPGRLIVVEGPDGVGKSTICKQLRASLRRDGVPCELLSFPGKEPGSIGELVYRVHHDQKSLGVQTLSPLARQALHVAAHLDLIDRRIMPLLETGHVVILDRFWWSAWVYGLVGGCHRRKLRALVEAERSAWGNLKPTLAVLLRRDTPINRDDRPETWNRLAEEYAKLVDRERNLYPVAVIDNVGNTEDTLELVMEQLGSSVIPRKAEEPERLFDMLPEPKPNRPAATHILPIRPTIVYDSYWRFAAERQEIFFKRVCGVQQPWTTDPVLVEYKFTNAYRASDRVSQYLIRHVIYREDLPAAADEVFFRIMLFKFFNKIETWEALQRAVGPITLEDYSFPQYDRVLSKAMERGEAIYSAAYIMPSGGKTMGHDRKHRNHLALLERMVTESLPERLTEVSSMQKAFTLLRSYPSIGDFLAYQYVTDINYSEITNFSEAEFVVPGPGSLDGIRKCFTDLGGLGEPEIIKFMADRQEQEFARLGLSFRTLWGRPLQLIDCQNLFCEVDKYARVMHPEVAGISGRQRIKQRFEETPRFPRPWYPPKWGINPLIEQSFTATPNLESA
jgi:thymidylate kinase